MSSIQAIQNTQQHIVAQGGKKAPSLSFEAFINEKYPELSAENKGVKEPSSDSKQYHQYYQYRAQQIGKLFSEDYDIPTDQKTKAFMDNFGLDKKDVQFSDGNFYVKFLNGTGGYGYLISDSLDVLQKDLLYFHGLGGNVSWDPQHKFDTEVAKKSLPSLTKTEATPVVTAPLEQPNTAEIPSTQSTAPTESESAPQAAIPSVIREERSTPIAKAAQNESSLDSVGHTTKKESTETAAPSLPSEEIPPSVSTPKVSRPIVRNQSLASVANTIKTQSQESSKSFSELKNMFYGMQDSFRLASLLLKSEQLLLG